MELSKEEEAVIKKLRAEKEDNRRTELLIIFDEFNRKAPERPVKEFKPMLFRLFDAVKPEIAEWMKLSSSSEELKTKQTEVENLTKAVSDTMSTLVKMFESLAEN